MAKFRKKPVVVEAEQFSPDQFPWPEGVYRLGQVGSGEYGMLTLEGPYSVTPGDWIITGVKGEKYPCKPDIFQMTYDQVK